jgi:hypothetical protein
MGPCRRRYHRRPCRWRGESHHPVADGRCRSVGPRHHVTAARTFAIRRHQEAVASAVTVAGEIADHLHDGVRAALAGSERHRQPVRGVDRADDLIDLRVARLPMRATDLRVHGIGHDGHHVCLGSGQCFVEQPRLLRGIHLLLEPNQVLDLGDVDRRIRRRHDGRPRGGCRASSAFVPVTGAARSTGGAWAQQERHLSSGVLPAAATSERRQEAASGVAEPA